MHFDSVVGEIMGEGLDEAEHAVDARFGNKQDFHAALPMG